MLFTAITVFQDIFISGFFEVFTKEKMQAMGLPEDALPQGWWIGFYIDDDDAWEKIKSGDYRMFSIEGTGTRVSVEGGEDE